MLEVLKLFGVQIAITGKEKIFFLLFDSQTSELNDPVKHHSIGVLQFNSTAIEAVNDHYWKTTNRDRTAPSPPQQSN